MLLHGGTQELIDRPFRVIAFDWDGTAVPDRTADATDLVAALEAVLIHGVVGCIITGTKFAHIERQCTQALSARAKRNLYVCTNRGSEVYAFTDSGDPQRIYLRTATDAENVALDRAARALQDELGQAGVHSEIVFDRLNRRKVDLIPTERWRDPKKSEFPELLRDVQQRLAPVEGGIGAVMMRARDLSIAAGLTQAKITSDIKHIEIGLTDKGDSVLWLRDNVIVPRQIPSALILIGGDEFGPIGAVPGSDSFMRVPGLESAVYVSVGKEPNGVPAGVVALGGGPARFIELLRARTHMAFDRRTTAR